MIWFRSKCQQFFVPFLVIREVSLFWLIVDCNCSSVILPVSSSFYRKWFNRKSLKSPLEDRGLIKISPSSWALFSSICPKTAIKTLRTIPLTWFLRWSNTTPIAVVILCKDLIFSSVSAEKVVIFFQSTEVQRGINTAPVHFHSRYQRIGKRR